MSASDFFCSSREGLRTRGQIQLSRDGRMRAKNKTIEISNPGLKSGGEQEMRCKASVPSGGTGGTGRSRLEVAAAGLRRHRQSLSCWKSFAVLSRMPLCAFCSRPGMHHAYDQHFPPLSSPQPPPAPPTSDSFSVADPYFQVSSPQESLYFILPACCCCF